MFRYYNVYLIDINGKTKKYIDTIKALSEHSAEEQCYMRFGSASAYTGWGRKNFKAVQA